MQTLITHYSLSEIILFAIILALAVKGFITFFDWAYARLKTIYWRDFSSTAEKEKIQQRFEKGAETMKALQENQQKTDCTLQELSSKINCLILSDRDDIKSYITRQHHYFCYRMGWIDDFSLNCIEKRYSQYREYGGNSFIENFMQQLRHLPKEPPTILKEQQYQVKPIPFTPSNSSNNEK